MLESEIDGGRVESWGNDQAADLSLEMDLISHVALKMMCSRIYSIATRADEQHEADLQ